jgi:outer membrane protein OmpA-like peptidoglycan-associated protein
MKKTAIILSLILLVITNLHAEDKNLSTRFGLYGHFGLNFHTADFKQIPECPSCSPGYESGIGLGPSFGLLFEYPIAESSLISLRLGYNDYSAIVTRTEETTVFIEGVKTAGAFEHSLDASLSQITFEPIYSYNVFDAFFLSGGFQLGFPLSGSYDQKEEIVEPANSGTFIIDGEDTGSRINNAFSGDFESLSSLNYGLIFGASYELPLNKKGNLLFVPEIYFTFGLSDVLDASKVNESDYGSWKANALRGGIAIKYLPDLEDKKERFRQIDKFDTVRIEKPMITEVEYKKGTPFFESNVVEEENEIITTETVSRIDTLFVPIEYEIAADINAVGVNDNNLEVSDPEFLIEEFTSRKLQPLLNYIFFDDNSSEIPSRYKSIRKSETAEFDENKLYQNGTLENYYDLLNIVAGRLRKNPTSKLVIIGCNSGVGKEKNNKKLSEARANEVLRYFVDIWEINDDRLRIVVRNLPEKASTPIEEADKTQENRRVELYSEDYEIMKPLYLNDTLRTSNPPIVRFYPEVKSDLDIKKWSIDLYQNNQILKSFPGDSEVSKVEWRLEDDQKAIPKLEIPVEYVISATDIMGNEGSSGKKSFSVKQKTISKKRQERIGDKVIDKYSLILFDFDKSNISGRNKMIVDLINNNLSENSEIVVIGYTDRTGNDDYNLDLSERRALSTTKTLDFDAKKVEGVGESVILYDNDIPEGRFYCRTVEIIVETPIK